MPWKAAVLALALAGCASAPGGAPTLTAWEALDQVQAFKPGLPVFSVRGLEGGRPGPASGFLGLSDDGLADGALGDGRLSSWAVSLAGPEGLLEVQVFADGREPALRNHDLPYALLDERRADAPLPAVDSPAVAAAALGGAGFSAPPGPATGLLYTFARHGAAYVDSGDDAAQDPLALVGWPGEADAWAVARFSASGLEPFPVAEVAGDGSLVEVRASLPTVRRVLADASVALSDPVPGAATPGEVSFTVPEGAADLEGEAWAPVLVEGEYRVLVLDADGAAVYDSARDGAFRGFSVAEPKPGEWTVRWTHDVPVPVPPVGPVPQRRMTVHAEAAVPLLA